MSNEILLKHWKHLHDEQLERRNHPIFIMKDHFKGVQFHVDVRAEGFAKADIIHIPNDEYEIVPIHEQTEFLPTEAITMAEYDSGMILETREEAIRKQVQKEDEIRGAKNYVPVKIPEMRYPKVKMTEVSMRSFFNQFLP